MVERLYNKILLPTDGSKYSERSLMHALLIAEASSAELVVLSVIENSFALGIPSSDSVNEINDLLHNEAKKNLESVVKLRDEHEFTVDISLKVGEGSPSKVIINTVEDEDIDLVVIGSSGKTGIDKFIMGSVADKVVKGAKCSVLVIR